MITYSQEREEAIKRVPANVDTLLSEMNIKIGEVKNFANSLEDVLNNKIELDYFKGEMLKKLDVTVFEKWFPDSQKTEPRDFFKSMINSEVEWVHKSILDMVKMWDQKLVKLRNEMNIQSIVKRIGEKADSVDVNEQYTTTGQRIEQLETTFM